MRGSGRGRRNPLNTGPMAFSNEIKDLTVSVSSRLKDGPGPGKRGKLCRLVADSSSLCWPLMYKEAHSFNRDLSLRILKRTKLYFFLSLPAFRYFFVVSTRNS